MSKLNGTAKSSETYLHYVSLKNYKSIKHAEIDLKPGLNIIIGKNSSGKTNFLESLCYILNFRYKELLESEYSITTLGNGNKVEFQAKVKYDMANDFLEFDNYSSKPNTDKLLKFNGEIIKTSSYQSEKEYLHDKKMLKNWIFLKYGHYYKHSAPFVNIPFNFVLLNNGKLSRDMMMATMDENNSEFILSFFHILYLELSTFFRLKKSNQFEDIGIKNDLSKIVEKLLESINAIIGVYTPIKSIRLNPDFNVVDEFGEQRITITNFYIEFLIDQNWLPFRLLSDGTKRLFYMISEILVTYDNRNNILLEEPELGIHPHQLHLLMQFIKEQSQQKQIIITTHSPQVLDTLEPDELDRIIICHYDPKAGTQLSHLSEKEESKAKKYMQAEAFLSDYWRFSDLEPAN